MIRLTGFILFFLMPVLLAAQRYSEDDMKVQALFVKANQLKLLAKYDEAIEIYTGLLEQDPLNAAVHHDLARIYLAKEDLEKAKDYAAKAVKYDRKQVWYLMTFGEICETSQDYTEAAGAFKKIALARNDINLYKRWADNLALAGSTQEAIEAYDAAETKFGIIKDFSLSKVDIWIASGDTKRAEDELKKLLKEDEDDVFLLMELADFYAYHQQEKNARKTYQQVLKLEPDNEYAVLAIEQLEKNKGGSEEFQRIDRLIRDSRISLDNKIAVLMPILNQEARMPEADRQDQLLSWTRRLVTDYPDEAKSHAVRADALMLSQQLAEAITAYQRTLELDRSVYEVWEQLMYLLVEVKDYQQLETVAEMALDYYPNQAGPYYFGGLAALQVKNLDAAEELAEEAGFIAGTTGPLSASVAILQSSILDERGDTAGALELIEQFIQTSKPRQPGVYELAGDLKVKSGDKTGAQTRWKQALEYGGDVERLNLKIQSI